MVNFYNLFENKLQKTDEPKPGTWIYAISPSESEVAQIAMSANIDPDYIRAALDEEEGARIELDDAVTLIIIDTPIAQKDEKNVVTYSTLPVGIITTSSYFITVCLKDNTVLKDFTDGYIKNANPAFKTRFFLQIMSHVAARYLQYLKQIDKITDYIEKRLHKATKNNELIQLLDLQKSLVYLSTSVKNIEVTLQKISRGRLIKLYEDDIDLLEDVIIEFKQAREMAEIFSSILSGTLETFSSVISNNLNVIMKILTSLTILMSIPTLISGFWGMNVADIPLGQSFWYPVGISVVITLIVAIILVRKKML